MADDMTADAMPDETGAPDEELGVDGPDPAMLDAGMETCVPEEAMTDPASDEMMQEGLGMGGVELMPVGDVAPAGLETHPYAELLPLMTAHEFADLKESIELDGLQVPVTLFGGKLLDGRNRRQACIELGIAVRAVEFAGTEAQALTHVLTANQYHREMTTSQRAAVAATLLPHIAEEVNQNRIAKLRETLRRKRENECQAVLPDTLEGAGEAVTTRAIAAHMMRVSDGYVRDALRIQQEAPALFEQLHAGQVTMPEALRTLDGTTTDVRTQQVKAACTRLNRILHSLDTHPDFLERFEAFLDQFTYDAE